MTEIKKYNSQSNNLEAAADRDWEIVRQFERKGREFDALNGISDALGLKGLEAEYADVFIGERILKDHKRDKEPDINKSIDKWDNYSITIGRKHWKSRLFLQPYIRFWQKPKLIKLDKAQVKYEKALAKNKESLEEKVGTKRVSVIDNALHNVLVRISNIEHLKDTKTQDEIGVENIGLSKLFNYWREELKNEPAPAEKE